MSEPITAAHAGCWINGHQGWTGVLVLIAYARTYGMELSEEDIAECVAYENGESETDAVFDMADEAETYLNTLAPDGYSFGWHDGEFFLQPHDWWNHDA